MSVKKRITETLLAPVVAAGASLAVRYAAKKGPELVESTLLPWLREASSGAGDVAGKLPDVKEKLPDVKVPDIARSAVSTGSDLAEKLTDRAREVTGKGDDGSSGGSSRSQTLSTDELSERSKERAKRRAQRRKATKGR